MIFSKNLTILLEEETENVDAEEETSIEESNEGEETETSDEPNEEETSDQPDEGDSMDDFSDEGEETEPSDEPNEEETSDQPDEGDVTEAYIRLQYFNRLKNLRRDYEYFFRLIKKFESRFKNDDISQDYNLKTTKYLYAQINRALEHMDNLTKLGMILKLDTDKILNVFAKLQTKLLKLLNLYRDMINKSL